MEQSAEQAQAKSSPESGSRNPGRDPGHMDPLEAPAVDCISCAWKINFYLINVPRCMHYTYVEEAEERKESPPCPCKALAVYRLISHVKAMESWSERDLKCDVA